MSNPVLRLDPESVTAGAAAEASRLLHEGLSHIRLGETDQAEAALRQVLALVPRDLDATVHLARLLIDRGRPTEAVALLAPGMEAAPDRMDAFEPLVLDLWLRGVTEAAPLLQRLAESERPSILACYYIGEHLARTDLVRANAYFERAANASPDQLLHWLYQALSIIRLGRAEEAEAPLRRVLTLEPQQFDASVHLARLLIDRDRTSDAIAVLEPAMEAAPDRIAALAPLVFDLWFRGVVAAEPLLRRVAESEPVDVLANYLMGETLTKTASPAASGYFQRAVRGQPQSSWQLLYQGLSLIRLGDTAGAEARLRQVLAHEPGQVDATIHLARLLIDHARPAEAVPLLPPAIESAPDRASTFAPLVFELWRRGVREAQPLLERLADGEPPDVLANFLIGEHLAGVRDERADTYFQRAVDASALSAGHRMHQALALIRLGQADRAEASLRDVLAAEPGHVDARTHLIRLMSDQRRVPEALAMLGDELESPERSAAFAPLIFEMWFRGVKAVAPLLRRLAAAEPPHVLANYLMGEELVKVNDPGARHFFERAISRESADVWPLLHQSLSLIRLGETTLAEARLRHVRARAPEITDATIHLVRLLIGQNRLADALAVLRSEIESAPHRMTVFAPLVCELCGRGALEAKPLLQRLADSEPIDTLANFLMGEDLVTSDGPRASTYFQRAAEAPISAPQYGLHKALSLIRLGHAEQAEHLLAQHLSIDPRNVQAANLLAEQHIARDEFPAAVAILTRVIDAGAPSLLSVALPVFRLRTRGVASADALLERIVERSSDDAAALAELAKLAYLCEATHWSIRLSAQARALADSPELRVSHDLALPLSPDSVEDIEFWLQRFRTNVAALRTSGLRIADPLKPFVQPPHYAPFCYGVNSRELSLASSQAWLALHPELGWTSPHCESWRSRPLRRRLRIAFLAQPTFPLVWGMARGLSRERFDVGLIYEQSARRQGKTPWSGAVDWEAAIPETSIAAGQRALADQELDILVHMPWFGFRYFLSHARLAPVQCVLTEPAYTDGSPNLDYYISWAAAEPARPEEFYNTAVALMDRPPYWVERDYTAPAALPRSAFDLPQDARWYVSPNTALKMHPTFDRMLARIFDADPKAIIVLLRNQFHQTRVVERRMRARFGAAADRLYVLPGLPADRCHALLTVADAVLDSWPIGGMSSSYAAIHAGVPTVTLPVAIPFGRWLASMYETMGIPDLIAADEDDYVRLALRLAADADWRGALGARIKAASGVFLEDHLAVDELEQFLIAAAEAAHRGDSPRPWRHGGFV